LWRSRPPQHATIFRCSVLIICILLAPGVCWARMVEQQAASRAPEQVEPVPYTELQKSGADRPANTTTSQKILVSSAAQLLESVMLGYHLIEVAAHINLSSTVGHSQNFLLISSGKIFMKVTHPL
jgi:hypothetical protein